MNLDKKFVAKTLCISAMCCILISNAGFAANEAKYTQEYASKLYDVAIKQEQTGLIEDALKNYTELQKANIAIYGKNSVQVGHCAWQLKNMYSHINPQIENFYLKEMQRFSLLNPEDNELAVASKRDIFYHYNWIEQPKTSIKEFEKVVTSQKEREDFISEYAYVYSVLKDFKAAKNCMKKFYKQTNKSDCKLLEYYYTNMYLAMDQRDFVSINNYRKNAETVLKKLKCNDSNIYHDINIARFYKDLNHLEESKNHIDKAASLAKNVDKLMIQYAVNESYFDYYRSIKDFKTQKKYLNKLSALNKKMYEKDYFANVRLYETFINYYRDIKEYNKAEKYILKNLDIIDEYKDSVPIIYAKNLKYLAEIKKDQGELDLALEYAKKSKEMYLKEFSENDYIISEIERVFGDIYSSKQEYKLAIAHYEKAISIITNTAGSKYFQIADINKELARVISSNGDYDNAIKTIDSAILLTKESFGKNNIQVVEMMLVKEDILRQNGKKDEANKLYKDIVNILTTNVEGYKPDVYFDFYFSTACNNFEDGNINVALETAQSALKAAKDKERKVQVESLLSEIYKAEGEKIKSIKFKLKSKI